jgi:hypothetical protein
MFQREEDIAICWVAKEASLENAHMNLVCMEGLITNATKAANLKRDRCALVAQQANHAVLEMGISEENAQNRFADDTIDFASRPLGFWDEPPKEERFVRPTFSPPRRTHKERPARRYF